MSLELANFNRLYFFGPPIYKLFEFYRFNLAKIDYRLRAKLIDSDAQLAIFSSV